jgi:raffinose/stachyose/melibiose transport system substrate-binding protein
MTQHSRIRRSASPGVVLLAALTGVALAGCSAGGSGGGNGSGSGGDANSFTLGVPITESGDSPYQLAADAYMEENPDVTIELKELPNDGFAQAINTQLQSGSAPDVFYVQPGTGNTQSVIPYAEAGYLEPLTGTESENIVPETAKQDLYYEDELYAHPLDLSVVSAVVNDTAAEGSGWSMPETFGELVDSCQAIADEGKSVFVLAGTAPPNTGLLAMILASSRVYGPNPDWNAQRQAGEVTFADDQGWQDSLQAIIDLKDAGCFQPGAEGGDFAAITNGLGQGTSFAGFVPSGAAFGLGAEAPDSTFTVQAVPAESAADTVITASANNALGVNAKSEKKEAGIAFLDWLSQPENAVTYAQGSGNLPITGLDTSQLPPQYQPVASYLDEEKYVSLPNAGWANGEVYTNLGVGVQGLLTGQTTVEDVLASMDQAWG